MIVLIDGYNMLHQIFPGVKGKLEKEKKILIKRLATYKNIKKSDVRGIIIVFDAGPLRYATREVHGGIVVMHAGQASSADEWIVDHIKKNKEQEFVIVTRDREIIDSCKPYNIQALDGQYFYELITKAIFSANHPQEVFYDQNIQKFTSMAIEDLEEAASISKSCEFDLLMQQATTIIPIKKEQTELDQQRIKPTKKLSKKEKKLYSTLKKLS